MDSSARQPRGFTLLEILVVLAIVGLLAGMALPQLQRMMSSVELSNQRTDIKLAIEGLGYRAYTAGKPITLTGFDKSSAKAAGADTGAAAAPGQSAYPLQVPPGWRIQIDQPIAYSINGVCGGGRVSIIDPENRRETFQLRPPKCLLEPVEAAE